MSSRKEPSLKRLQTEWTRKLKRSGFKDIEDSQGRLTDHQNVYDFSQRVGFRQDLFTHIQDYYRWAEHAIHWAKFKSSTDEVIWYLHFDGKSSREISEEVHLNQRWVSRKIKIIRAYLLEQELKAPK